MALGRQLPLVSARVRDLCHDILGTDADVHDVDTRTDHMQSVAMTATTRAGSNGTAALPRKPTQDIFSHGS